MKAISLIFVWIHIGLVAIMENLNNGGYKKSGRLVVQDCNRYQEPKLLLCYYSAIGVSIPKNGPR